MIDGALRQLSRLDLPALWSQALLTGYGAEIGAQKGEFARQILQRWAGKKLYLIDCWRPIAGYRDIANVSLEGHFGAMGEAVRNIAEFDDRAVVIRERSLEAARLFPAGVFDFVYIDADHSFEAVALDVAAWAPKVRPGGFLCGHDYLDNPNHPFGNFGVKRAVEEFAKAHGLAIGVTCEPDFPSWLIQLSR